MPKEVGTQRALESLMEGAELLERLTSETTAEAAAQSKEKHLLEGHVYGKKCRKKTCHNGLQKDLCHRCGGITHFYIYHSPYFRDDHLCNKCEDCGHFGIAMS